MEYRKSTRTRGRATWTLCWPSSQTRSTGRLPHPAKRGRPERRGRAQAGPQGTLAPSPSRCLRRGARRAGCKGRLMAAVLSCGPGAVVSHRSAASLIGLATSPGSAIEVSVPCRSGRAQPGVIVHRSRTLDAADTMLVESIPCTTVARTLLDLADVQPARRLLPSIDAAERLGLYDGRAVAAVLHRAGGRPAARRLTSVLAVYEGPPATKSELEPKALDLVRRGGPSPAAGQHPGRNGRGAPRSGFPLAGPCARGRSRRLRLAFGAPAV
jgi:hypothetical protein